MDSTKTEFCLKQIQTVGEELGKGYYRRVGARIEALCKLGQDPAVFQGWASDAACFLVHCGKSAEDEAAFRPLALLLERLAEIVCQQAEGMECDVVWEDMAAVVQDVESLVDKSDTPGLWPAMVPTFKRYAELAEEKKGGTRLPAVGGFRLTEAQLGNFWQAASLSRAGAVFLGALARTYGYRGFTNSTLFSLSRMASYVGICRGGDVFVSAVVEGLRCGWCPPEKSVLLEIYRMTIEQLEAVGQNGIQEGLGYPMVPWEVALFEVLSLIIEMCSGNLGALIEGLLVALGGIPWDSKLWSSLFDALLSCLNMCGSPQRAEAHVNKFMSDQGLKLGMTAQMRALAALVSRMHDLKALNIDTLIINKVLFWLDKGIRDLTGYEELQSLGLLLVEFMPRVLVGALLIPPGCDVQKQLNILLVKINHLHAFKPVQVQALLLSLCLDCLGRSSLDFQVTDRSMEICDSLLQEGMGLGAQAISVALLPFACLFQGLSVQECTARLLTNCDTENVLVKAALAQALGFLGIAYGSQVSTPILSAAVGEACTHMKNWALGQTSWFRYPECGSTSIRFATLEPVCDMILTESDPKFMKVVLTSMSVILLNVEDNGLFGAQPALEKLLQCMGKSGYSKEKKHLVDAFCRASVLEEWADLPVPEAEKKLIQDIVKTSVSSHHTADLLEALYPHMSEKPSKMRLFAALMVFLTSSDSAKVGRVLEDVAAQEGTTLSELVLEESKEHFEVLFMQRPDVMDAVSKATQLPDGTLPKAYLGVAFHMCWKSKSAVPHAAKALGNLIQRLGPGWRQEFFTELQSAIVTAIWRAQKTNVEQLLEITQGVSGIQQGEWTDLLAGRVEYLAEQAILASGEDSNWQNGNSSVQVADRCKFCLQTIAEICHLPELDMNKITGQQVFVSKVLSALDSKLSSGGSAADRLCAWRTLTVFLLSLRRDDLLMQYSPHLLAVIRAGLKGEEDETAASEGVDALALVLDAEMISVAKQHSQILQEIVVALAPALRMGGDGFKAGYCLLSKLTSQCSKEVLRSIAAITYNIRRGCDPDSTIELVFEDLRSSGFFNTSGAACPLFTELCLCLASDSGPVLLESLHSMQLFLQRNATWVRRLACGAEGGDTNAHGLTAVAQALQSLLVCLGRTRRSEEGRKMNLLCARCLGLIGAIDPRLASIKTMVALRIPDSEVTFVLGLVGHLVRVLFSGDLKSVEAASHALGQVLQCKVTKPESESSRRKDGVSVRSVVEDSATISQWISSSPASIEICAEAMDTSELLEIGELTLRHWLVKWLFYLESAACGSLAPVLKLVIAAQAFDMPSMMCLLPYLLHNVITEGKPDAHDVIVNGLLAVIDETNKVAKEQAQRIDTQKCQMVFLLLDFLRQWATRPPSGGRKAKKINEVLGRIDHRKLAEAAFHCGGYTRALQYLEAQLLAEKKGGLNPSAARIPSFSDEEVSFLMQIYSQLDEPDGLSGLVHLRTSGLSTFNRITVAEQQGDWDHAIALWESTTFVKESAAAKVPELLTLEGEPSSKDPMGMGQIQRGQVQCLLRAGRLELALDKAWTILTSKGYGAGTVAQIGAGAVEACWKLGQWKELQECLNIVHEKSSDQADSGVQFWALNPHEDWNLRIGKILHDLQQPQTTESLVVAFEEQFANAQAAIMRLLPGRAAESYAQCYPFLLRLQMLEEVEYGYNLLKAGTTGKKSGKHTILWDPKMNTADNSIESQGALLQLRRQLAVILEDPVLEQEQFLEMARISRKAGSARLAMKAWHMELSSSTLDYIKAMWSAGKHELAIEELEIENNRLKAGGSLEQLSNLSSKQYRAKLVLLLSRWKTGRDSQQELRQTFEEAKMLDAQWHKPCMYFAKYLDGLYQDAQLESGAQVAADRKDRLQGRSRIKAETEEHFARMLPQIFENYGRAAYLSSKHAQDCLSRILTLYFELGDIVSKRAVTLPENLETPVHKSMSKVQQEVPTSLWYLVLPQLVSRICHPWRKLQGWIEKTVRLVADDFPHHTLWSLAFVMSSGIKDRKSTAKHIVGALGESKGCNTRGRGMASAFIAFVEELVKLCMANISGKDGEINGHQNFPKLFAMFDKLPYGIIVPVQNYIRGPPTPVKWADQSLKPSSGLPTIAGMKPTIRILQSLMSPRKIVFIGSDGQEYPFLAKPKDDLRKDSRLMELCSVLNHYFKKNVKARKRNLHLRTFMVLPLKEDCGILEWVDGLVSLRAVCESTYRLEEGGYPKKKYFMSMHEKEGWLDLVLEDLKPCLHKCFLRVFSTPDKWLNARLSFARTTAAWSMVGHTVGLGDRHTENVNLDTFSGDVVHVDFGCLFDQGLTLNVPEVTPFRLTQNMVDGFGVSGVEGVFMNSAGIVLKVLREHREPLLTCLKSFLHDPLVKWVESKSTVEVENPYAKDAILTIEGRLLGKLIGIKSERSSPLSCEGHVSALVKEATNKTNLANMYLWWMPWL